MNTDGAICFRIKRILLINIRCSFTYCPEPFYGYKTGYNLLTTGIDLLSAAEDSPLCGIFNDDHLPYEFDGYTTEPHLHEMASAALKNLDTDPDGFFLMIEGVRMCY
jgi:hypothetical protein